ncbi:MAG: winged helix-turn-helix domain-containing protein [Myxococcota bacterium]
MGQVSVGSWTLNPTASELRRGGERLHLSPLEREFLRYIAERPGQTVTREELLREVWNYAPQSRSRAIFSTVSRLRLKLGGDAACIVNIYGLGYRFEPAGDPGLIGRDRELQRLSELLTNERVCVVWGLGGIGKTRLVRSGLRPGHTTSPTTWIEATSMTEVPELVLALARTMGLERPSLASVTLALGAAGSMNLVIDGAEQIGTPIVQPVTQWLMANPQLRIVLTSRTLLGNTLPSLPLRALDVDAGQTLFLRCAAQSGVSVESDPDVDELRSLVDQLAGLPLAIELAAARTRVLPIADLRRRLETSLEVLEVGERSVASILAVSWRLLTPEDQRILRLAALFPVPFSVEQLERVAREEVIDELDHLVTTSLVVRDGRRWRLPELVRRFASAKQCDEDRASYRRATVAWARDLWTDPTRGSETHRQRLLNAVPVFVDALRLATETTDAAHLAIAIAFHDALMGPVARMRPHLERLTLEKLTPPIAAEVQLRLAHQAHRAALPDAVRFARRGLRLAEQIDDAELTVSALKLMMRLTAGKPEQTTLRARLRTLSDSSNSKLRLETRAKILLSDAHHLMQEGRALEALDRLRTCLAWLNDDELELKSYAVKAISEALNDLGRHKEGIGLLERTFDEMAAHEGSGAHVRIGVGLAATLIDLGERERAAEILPGVLQAAQRGGYNSMEAVATLNLASVASDPATAEQLCVQAREVARRGGRTDLAASAEGRLGRKKLERGQARKAIESLQRALGWLGETTPRRAWLRLLLSLAQWVSGDGQTAQSTLDETHPMSAADRHALVLCRLAVREDFEGFEEHVASLDAPSSKITTCIQLIRQIAPLGSRASAYRSVSDER